MRHPLPSELREAQRNFGLQPCSEPLEIMAATANRIYRIQEEDRVLALRMCVRNDDRRRLQSWVALQHQMAKGSSLVPRLHRDRTGRHLSCSGLFFWTLSDWLAGEHFDYTNDKQLVNSAVALARFHESNPLLEIPTFVNYRTGVEVWLDPPAATTLFQQAELLPAERLKHFQHYAGHLLCQFDYQRYAALGQTWTHGDFHGLNLLFCEDRLAGVLDFEMAGRRPRAYDVAFSLLMMTRRARGDYTLQPARIRSFLRAYESAAPALSKNEIKALPSLMALSHMPDLLHLKTLRDSGFAIDNHLGSMLSALEALQRQTHFLKNLLSDLWKPDTLSLR